MENIKLDTKIRTDAGKGAARKLRAAGEVPAILYGQKEEPLSLSVDESTFKTVVLSRADSSIIDLNIEGGKIEGPLNAIVRDVQRHPATGKLLHIDFQRIRLDQKIRVEVSVTVTGEPKGVKVQGGILEHGTRSLTVLCLPAAIPETIQFDVSGLMIGDSIQLKEVISGYPGVEFQDDEDITLAHVVPPTVEAEREVDEEAAAEGEPELVAKDKDGEEAGKEEDSGKGKSS
jgi:large subunit ribosomal protein L25